MVHLSFVERVRLLPRASIAISILCFRKLIDIVSSLPALETSNVTQILLGGCRGVGTALTVASSIPFTILRATMVM